MAIDWKDKGCEAKRGFWKTADEKLFKIEDMSIRHIENCINYIWKYGGELREFEYEKIDELKNELRKRDLD